MMSRSSDDLAILPVFLPHRGCPGRCSFCEQRIQSGTRGSLTPAEAESVLRVGLEVIERSGRHGALAFYGGSFDGLSGEERASWLALAQVFRSEGLLPRGVRISAHPAGLTARRIEELRQGGVVTVEVGVQSLEDEALALANRGHDAAQALGACRRVMDAGLRCVVQLMTGLPGANGASDEATARGIAALGPHGVRIHPTLVLRGTRLEEQLEEGEWSPPDLDEAVTLVAGMVEILEAADVTIYRLGIQDTDGLRERVVAGAWHSAFGELVRGELLAQRLARNLAIGVNQVQVPSSEASQLLGHGRRGLKRLEALVGRDVAVVVGAREPRE